MGKSAKNRGAKAKPDSSLVVYRGPVLASHPSEPQIVRVPLKYRYPVTAASAGYIETYLQTNNAQNSNEWSTYANMWREYRILGMRFDYRCFYDKGGFNGAALQYSTGSICPYHGAPPPFQGAVTTGTDLSVWQMDGAVPFHPGTNVTVEWRMQDIEEAQFFNTSAPTGCLGGIYAMVPNATASKQYGTLYATWLVEFKGRI